MYLFKNDILAIFVTKMLDHNTRKKLLNRLQTFIKVVYHIFAH